MRRWLLGSQNAVRSILGPWWMFGSVNVPSLTVLRRLQAESKKVLM
jgi:hypothetical protein